MPPKKGAADIGDTFSCGTVQYRVQRSGLVTVGVNQTGPGGKEHLVRMRKSEPAKDAVLRKLKELANKEQDESASSVAANCDGEMRSAHDEAGRVAARHTAADDGGAATFAAAAAAAAAATVAAAAATTTVAAAAAVPR
eukprot:2093651-Prymnesium_polylepis.1